MAMIDRVRALFGMAPRATFAGPARVQFSGDQIPFRSIMDGLFRGIGTVDREQALSVPAILRGRNLLCSIGTLPLEAVDAANRLVDHPLLAQPDPNVPRVVTLSQTVEDLLFQAVSWWRITRFDVDGMPVNAVRYAPEQVSITPPAGHRIGVLPSDLPTTGVVYMDGVPVPYGEVIRFDSPNPGLLSHMDRTVNRALALDIMAEVFARNPRPNAYLFPQDGADPASDEAIAGMLDDIVSAAAERGIVYIPAALGYQAIQQPTPNELQLVPQQQRVTLDIANGLGIDPEDLGVNTTSRTYQNATDRRQDRINETYAPYMKAITDRLGMPDITERGVTVRFRLADYLKADPKTRAEVQQIYHTLGVTDAAEIREQEGLPPRSITPPPIRVAATLGQPAPRQIQAHAELATFDADTLLTFDFLPSDPNVDHERRTITGLVVPYGKQGRSKGVMFRFAPGSLRYADVHRVKLLRDHDNTQALGRAIRTWEDDAGQWATFKVDDGPEGDRALAQAKSGTLDGLSPGIDARPDDVVEDRQFPGGFLVIKAAWRETSLTAVPSFDDSRLVSIRAHRDQEGTGMDPEDTQTTGAATAVADPPSTPPAAAGPVTFSAEQFAELTRSLGRGDQGAQAAAAVALRPTVDPTTTEPRTTATRVREALPYTFAWRDGRHIFAEGRHEFSADVFAIVNGRADQGAVDRINAMIQAQFAAVDTTGVAALTPHVYRPDLWQPQMDYVTPLWDMVNSGATDGRPFDLPKFSSSSGLVGPLTEGTEPAAGAYAATLQTITPTQVGGKIEITRKAARRPATPQLSGILWDQMLREYYEDRENAVATFLATLTAATDITLTGRPATTPDNDDDQATVGDFMAALTDLQFVRGGNRFSAFAVHQDLYRVFSRVTDDSGRPLFPQIAPQNANGTAQSLFRYMDVGGTRAVPSWALGAGGQTTATNSWLFDPQKVRGWASAPERLDWNFGATIQDSTNVPQVSMVTIGIYGDVAFGNLDIAGVRQVIFDPSV